MAHHMARVPNCIKIIYICEMYTHTVKEYVYKQASILKSYLNKCLFISFSHRVLYYFLLCDFAVDVFTKT